MEIIQTYFKFIDPVSGNVSKDIGWVTTHQGRNTIVLFKHPEDVLPDDKVDLDRHTVSTKLTGLVPVVLKDEPAQGRYPVRPPYKNLTKISKEEFDALDVSGESPACTEGRERRLKRLERYRAVVASRLK